MEQPRICIIGAGIGGASTAWHLRRVIPSCSITVLEQADIVGGRLASWHDQRVASSEDESTISPTIEIGGAIFHTVNETMVELAKACEVPLLAPDRPDARHTEAEVYGTLPEVGVWDDSTESWALRAGGSVWGLLRLVWRYGWDLVRVSRHANAVKVALQNMYSMQREEPDRPFCRSVEEMLSKTGLDKWAGCEFSQLGYASNFVAECLDPIARTIYSRGAASVNGYCGLAAVIAADGGGLYSCPGGNATIVSKLLQLSRADLRLGHSVASVRRSDGDAGDWVVSACGASGSSEQMHFDIVVLAVPWETSGLELELLMEEDPLRRRLYRQMVVSLVAGQPAIGGGSVPQTVLSCGAGQYEGTFYSMGAVATMKDGGDDIWKVFSAAALTDAQLAGLFQPGHEVLLVHCWRHCFPELSPQHRYPPMCFTRGCYFANAMEALAPSMEAAAWCGKNVALMIAEDFGPAEKPRGPT